MGCLCSRTSRGSALKENPPSTRKRTLPSTAGKLPPSTSQKRSPSTGNGASPSTGDETLTSTAKQFPPKKLSSQKPPPSTSNGPSPSTPQKPSSSTGNGASPSTSQKPSPPAVNKASPSTVKNISSSILQEPSLSTGKKASPPTGNETLPSTAKQLSTSASQKPSLPTGNGTLPSNAIKPSSATANIPSPWTVNETLLPTINKVPPSTGNVTLPKKLLPSVSQKPSLSTGNVTLPSNAIKPPASSSNIPSNETPLPTISDALHRADDDLLSAIKTLYNSAAPIKTNVQTVMKKLAARNFVQWIKDRDLLENDQTEILKVMQRGLAENKVLSDDERQHIAKNLHTLLRVFKQLLPNPQLDSGEIEWSSQASKNADMHKGRFLHSEDVRVRVIRSADMRDGGSIQRIRDEFEVWAKLHKQDQGKHIIPFHGFYSPDGLHLALVSPWMNNGNALAYVKNRDKDINYGKLILGIAEGIKILHSMEPPIVHGNLRAKNIYIGDEGQPLITDYGLTKFEGNLTATDSCRWCAPEMFQQQASVSTKSDVYSFGMTILELLTHQMPYANIKKTAQVVAKKRESGLPDRPQDERIIERGLDDKMWNILCQCWSKNPSNRIKVDKLVTSFRSLLPSEGNGGLLAENGIVPQSKNNTQPNQERSFHPSRPLARLVSELITNGIIANQKQIDLLLKLLNLPDYDGTIPVLKASSGTQLDSYVQLLIEIILRLLQDGTLLRSGISDAQQKARRLMFELVSETDGMPRSLSITDIKTDKVRDITYMGRRRVTLQAISKVSITKSFWRDALGWRSLAHHERILPLLGIFEAESNLFLVSPFMSNETLTLMKWRSKQGRDVDVTEIHRLMREVAEGVAYIHSQGIVHGNLCGETILLSPDLDCKIADFGLTRYIAVDKKVDFSPHPNFTAPELFGMCATCTRQECNGCSQGDMNCIRTMRTDVYAFGCLYFAVFYDSVPFQGKESYPIMSIVTKGQRPSQSGAPIMEADIWNLIQKCWKQKPSLRPSMKAVEAKLLA